MEQKDIEKLIYGEQQIAALDDYLSTIGNNSTFKMMMEKTPEIADYLKESYDIDIKYAFLAGCNAQKGIKDDVWKPTIDFTTKINFLVVLDFGDNDFGGYFKEAANRWCDLFNSEIKNFELNSKLDKTSTYVIDYIYPKIENLMSITTIYDYITNELFMSMMKFHNRIDVNSKTKRFPKIKDIIRECNESMKYLDITVDKFKIGSIEEIKNYVIDSYKGQQSKEWNETKQFDKMWLNGELLFIKVENGFATSWVK